MADLAIERSARRASASSEVGPDGERVPLRNRSPSAGFVRVDAAHQQQDLERQQQQRRQQQRKLQQQQKRSSTSSSTSVPRSASPTMMFAPFPEPGRASASASASSAVAAATPATVTAAGEEARDYATALPERQRSNSYPRRNSDSARLADVNPRELYMVSHMHTNTCQRHANGRGDGAQGGDGACDCTWPPDRAGDGTDDVRPGRLGVQHRVDSGASAASATSSASSSSQTSAGGSKDPNVGSGGGGGSGGKWQRRLKSSIVAALRSVQQDFRQLGTASFSRSPLWLLGVCYAEGPTNLFGGGSSVGSGAGGAHGQLAGASAGGASADQAEQQQQQQQQDVQAQILRRQHPPWRDFEDGAHRRRKEARRLKRQQQQQQQSERGGDATDGADTEGVVGGRAGGAGHHGGGDGNGDDDDGDETAFAAPTLMSEELAYLTDFRKDFESRLWMTYRSNFPRIAGSSFSTDAGWGCTLRSGQMLLAQALVLYMLGRDWRIEFCHTSRGVARTYLQILRWFDDQPVATSPFSIHAVSQLSHLVGKNVGDWFGPSTLSQVLRTLVNDVDRTVNPSVPPLVVHLAMDQMVYKDEVHALCSVRNVDTDETTWTPVMLLLPLRLGVSTTNEVYYDGLKAAFTFPHCCGMVGGRPKMSLYFIGFQDDNLLYLDPHVCRRAMNMRHEAFTTASYHCNTPRKMSFRRMDPSVAIGFFCRDEADFKQFCNLAEMHFAGLKAPLFTVAESNEHPHRRSLPGDPSWSARLGTNATSTGDLSGGGGEASGGGGGGASDHPQDGGDDDDDFVLL